MSTTTKPLPFRPLKKERRFYVIDFTWTATREEIDALWRAARRELDAATPEPSHVFDIVPGTLFTAGPASLLTLLTRAAGLREVADRNQRLLDDAAAAGTRVNGQEWCMLFEVGETDRNDELWVWVEEDGRGNVSSPGGRDLRLVRPTAAERRQYASFDRSLLATGGAA